MSCDSLLAESLLHHRAGRLAEAEAGYRRILREDARHADALHLLGVVALQQGNSTAAAELITQAIAVQPHAPDYHHHLGQACAHLGRWPAAVEAYSAALTLRPNEPDILLLRGQAHRALGQLDAAAGDFSAVLAVRPAHAEATVQLAALRLPQGRGAEVLPWIEVAVQQHPADPALHQVHGAVLAQIEPSDAARAAFERAAALLPGSAEIQKNIGYLHQQAGRPEAAIAAFRRALAVDPAYAPAWHALLFTLWFDPALTLAEILREHQAWAARLPPPAAPAPRSRSPGDRRLRVGYVSSDLSHHPVGRNVRALFLHSDRAAFEVFVYSSTREQDGLTAELRRSADAWRDVSDLDDAALHDLIRADAIDLLIDLNLHTNHHRLGVFARKPAPVQLTFAGYPGTTGLAAIDYRITDPHLEGERDGTVWAERPLVLPHSFWCFDPGENPPAATRKPSARGEPFTWGCLNSPAKIHDTVLASWVRILRASPGSRLLVLAQNSAQASRLRAALADGGIAPARLELLPRQARADYLRAYNRCDVILDTFPYHGHTTTCEALWMGVPVVTRAGPTPVARGGLSLLANLGLRELVAADEAGYEALALGLAADLPRLHRLQAELRARMEASPLMDGPRFARDFEALLRQAWCNAGG